MTKRLLERQVELLNYLTSSAAIFPAQLGAPLPSGLHGIDPALLNLEARFSHEKRVEKIAAIFPMTFELLGAGLNRIMPDFVAACPPFDISRIENAGQFHAFLTARWKQAPPSPPWLADIAACEFACAKVRVAALDRSSTQGAKTNAGAALFRRDPACVLLRARFDIREMFEKGEAAALPTERACSLAIALNAGEPRIFELAPETFDLVGALNTWIGVNDLPDARQLIAELADVGILELSR